MLLERGIEVVHVRRVVLVVMDPHRLFVDVRLQGGVVVAKFGQYVLGHKILQCRGLVVRFGNSRIVHPGGWRPESFRFYGAVTRPAFRVSHSRPSPGCPGPARAARGASAAHRARAFTPASRESRAATG